MIRPSRDNFYVDVIHAIQEAFNITPSSTDFITPLLLGGMCVVGIAGIFSLFGLVFGKSPSKSRVAEQK